MLTSRTGRHLCAVLVLALLAACSGSTDRAGGTKPVHPVVLRTLDTRSLDEVRPYVDAAQRLSTGSVSLTVRPNFEATSLRGEPDAIRAVRAGRADLAVVPARAWHPFGVTSFDALIAPMAIDSMALQRRVLASDLAEQMLAGVRRLGLVGLAILPGPMRKPVGISRDLLDPASYRGAVIADSPSVVADRSLRALGAIPAPSAFEGSNVSGFDGIELQVGGVAGDLYDSAARSITSDVDLWPRPLVVVANPAALAKLSHKQRTWLRSAGSNSLEASVNAQLRNDTVGAESLCTRNRVRWRNATPRQVRALMAAFSPVYQWLRRDPRTSAPGCSSSGADVSSSHRKTRWRARGHTAPTSCRASASG